MDAEGCHKGPLKGVEGPLQQEAKAPSSTTRASRGWKHVCVNSQMGEPKRFTRLGDHPSAMEWRGVDPKHVIRGLDGFMRHTV